MAPFMQYGGSGLDSKSCLTLATRWTVAHQAPLSMGSSRQEYWSGLQFPTPGDLPNLGIEPKSPALQAASLPFEPPGKHIIGKDMQKSGTLELRELAGCP